MSAPPRMARNARLRRAPPDGAWPQLPRGGVYVSRGERQGAIPQTALFGATLQWIV